MGALVSPAQAQRLTRKKWNTITEAMQELQTIFESTDPYVGPTINIQQQGDQTVLNIIPGGTPGNPSTAPPITTGPIPGPTTQNPAVGGGGGLPGTPGDTTIVPPSPSLPVGFPLTGWGIITGKVTDNIYNVNIYLGNPSSAPLIGNMQVEQRQIDPDDTIPVGTEVILMLTTSTVNSQIVITAGTMQVPVFLEP